MNYRSAHRTGTGKFQGRESLAIARKTPSRDANEKSAKLFQKIGYLLFFLAGVCGLALAMHQSGTAPEPSQNEVVYSTFRGDVWAMLQPQGR